jgi:hypothetical protein
MPNISKGFGIASFVCGLLSILLWFAPYIGLPLGILGIIFSIKQRKINSTGLATAGLILGIIGIVIDTLIIFIILIALFAAIWGKLL